MLAAPAIAAAAGAKKGAASHERRADYCSHYPRPARPSSPHPRAIGAYVESQECREYLSPHTLAIAREGAPSADTPDPARSTPNSLPSQAAAPPTRRPEPSLTAHRTVQQSRPEIASRRVIERRDAARRRSLPLP